MPDLLIYSLGKRYKSYSSRPGKSPPSPNQTNFTFFMEDHAQDTLYIAYNTVILFHNTIMLS
jgi:hypothetical protein